MKEAELHERREAMRISNEGMDGFYVEPLIGKGFLVVYETCVTRYTVACSTPQDILDALADFLKPYREYKELRKMTWPLGGECSRQWCCPWLELEICYEARCKHLRAGEEK